MNKVMQWMTMLMYRVCSVFVMSNTGQTATTGTLTGTVNDSGGTALAGARITSNSGGYTATTDTLGKYTISSIAAGTYSVICTATGYDTRTKAAAITANVTTTLNFTMSSAGVVINSLTATPLSFAGNAATTVTMAATITCTPVSYQWSQVAGPKVPLTAKAHPFQDKAYDVEFRGNYAYVADGTNGITVYDLTKYPSISTSGFYVANVGANKGDPLLGTASGIELWQNPLDSKFYAIVAAGPYGVGVADISDMANMKLVKVFEPIKIEDSDIGVADFQAIDVKLIGDKAYFNYDSFGVICYSLTDLIAAVPVGVDPTEIFLKTLDGTVIYDYRPIALGRFALDETVAGAAMRLKYTQQGGKLCL